ncbi:MAG: RHS repeat-associated core domain-containing protein [Chloroflexi bacterium]|nr:RHS repeat-associated core domain-containing protein [Chloroflexota bacterium]
MKKVVGGTTTYYVGNWYEVTNGAATKYYYFGAQRVAMKQGSAVTYLHGDHLGSTSATSGATNSSSTYYPFGAIRSGTLPTDYTFTGQKRDAEAGLMFYNARYYDANIGRFVQADTIVPNLYNPQSLNRYAYVVNNPVKYVDPTGNRPCGDVGEEDCDNPGGVGKPGEGTLLLTFECRSSSAKCQSDDPSTNQPPKPPVKKTNPDQDSHSDWHSLANPLTWGELLKVNVLPILLFDAGLLFAGGGVALCETLVGCIVSFEVMFPASAASFVSSYLLAQGAWEYDKKVWDITFNPK